MVPNLSMTTDIDSNQWCNYLVFGQCQKQKENTAKTLKIHDLSFGVTLGHQ